MAAGNDLTLVGVSATGGGRSSLLMVDVAGKVDSHLFNARSVVPPTAPIGSSLQRTRRGGG